MYSADSGTYTDPDSALNYRNNNQVQMNLAERFLANNGDLIIGPVIDVGCGVGNVTAWISDTFKVEVTGIDISPDRIQQAQADYGGKPSLRFKQVDAVSLDVTKPLDSEADSGAIEFNTAISCNVLHHIPRSEQPKLFKALYEILSPVGICLFLVPNDRSMLHRDMETVTASDEFAAYFQDFDIHTARTYEEPDYYFRLLREAGFEYCIGASEKPVKSLQMSHDKFKGFLRGWLPHLAHLKAKIVDEDQYRTIEDRFLDAIATRYLARTAEKTEGENRSTMNRLIACKSRAAFFGIRPATTATDTVLSNSEHAYNREEGIDSLQTP